MPPFCTWTLRVLGFLASLTFTFAAANAATPPAQPTPIEGTLPNGLSYFILPHHAQPGRVSLRLIVRAGSLDEHDDERGFAHFVEHMAFRGTTHYPPGRLFPFFQEIGLSLGADLNAETGFRATSYRLDLSSGHRSQLPEALQVLRDFAGGLTFPEREVNEEKGVVLSELRERDTTDEQAGIKFLSQLYAGTRIPLRFPSGDSALVASATAEKLRSFYERCYHPDRMTLIVIGDISPEKTIELATGLFSDLPASDASVLPAETIVPELDGPRATVLVNQASGADVTAAAVVEITTLFPRNPDTPAGRAESTKQTLLIAMMNRRLLDRRAQDIAHIGRAFAFFNHGPDRHLNVFGLQSHSRAGDWINSTTLLENELRRARENGFTADEIREATTILLTSLQEKATTFAGLATAVVANESLSALADRRTWSPPATRLAEAKAALNALTPEESARLFRGIFPEKSLHITLTAPEDFTVSQKQLLMTYGKIAGKALRLTDVKTTPGLAFYYTAFGTPGAVVARTSEADLHLDLVRFANGVKLNLRPSQAESNQFHLTARIGQGYFDDTPSQPGLAVLAKTYIEQCSLQHHTREEINRLASLKGITMSTTFSNNQLCLVFKGPPAELPFAFQFVTAFLTDLRMDFAQQKPALGFYTSLTSSIALSVEKSTELEFVGAMANRDRRMSLPGTKTVADYSFSQLTAWIRKRWLLGPLEVGVTGDFDPEQAMQTAMTTLGTLAPRADATLTASSDFKFPKKPERNVAPLPGSTEKAAVVFFGWPAPDGVDDRTFYALQFATDVLVDRLRRQFRETEGATYTPEGIVRRFALQRSYGYAAIKLAFDPSKDPATMSRRVLLAAELLARNGITREEFEHLGEPLRIRAREDLHNNNWWLNHVLLYAQTRPEVLADARLHATIFSQLTQDEINGAARNFLAIKSSVIGASPAK